MASRIKIFIYIKGVGLFLVLWARCKRAFCTHMMCHSVPISEKRARNKSLPPAFPPSSNKSQSEIISRNFLQWWPLKCVGFFTPRVRVGPGNSEIKKIEQNTHIFLLITCSLNTKVCLLILYYKRNMVLNIN